MCKHLGAGLASPNSTEQAHHWHNKLIESNILLKCLYCESLLIYNKATLIEDLNEVKFVLTNTLKIRTITFNTASTYCKYFSRAHDSLASVENGLPTAPHYLPPA